MKDPIVITFNLGPAGRPMFSGHPKVDEVPWGTVATLTWVLKPSPSASAAVFHPEVGIRFVPSRRYPAEWPFPQPEPVPGTNGLEYATIDANTKPGSDTTVYKYNVTVVVDGKTYTWDPEEENKGQGN